MQACPWILPCCVTSYVFYFLLQKKTPKCGGLKKQQFVIAHDAEVEQSDSSPLAQVTCVVHSAGSL